MKTKINKYYRNGQKVRSHFRGRVEMTKRVPSWKRKFAISVWIVLSVVFIKVFVDGLEWKWSQDKKVEAQEIIPDVSPLTKEQGFEQVAPTSRDQITRDGRSESVEQIIRRVFNEEPDFAVKIAQKESSLRTTVINDNPRTGDYSIGIYQINRYGKLAKSRPSVEWLQNPENNIQFAKGLYDACKKKTGNGWKCDWNTSWNKLNK